MVDPSNHSSMSKTLRVVFTSEYKPETRGAVMECIADVIELKMIDGVFKTGQGPHWYLSFTNKDVVDLMGNSVAHKGKKDSEFYFERIDTKRIRFRVHWFPLYLSKEYVMVFMGQYGKNISLSYDYDVLHGVTIKTGVLSGEMVVTERQYHDMPYRTKIFGQSVLVTIQGRLPMCLKCGVQGHFKANCTSTKAKTYAGATNSRKDDEIVVGSPLPQTRGSTEDASLPQDRRGTGSGVVEEPSSQDRRDKREEDEGEDSGDMDTEDAKDEKKRDHEEEEDTEDETFTPVKRSKKKKSAENNSADSDVKPPYLIGLVTPNGPENPIEVDNTENT